MLRFEDVVILMQHKTQDLEAVKFFLGDASSLNKIGDCKVLQPFDERVLDFLNELSKSLIQKWKSYPDIITFAFWCRRTSLMREKAKYGNFDSRLGRGIVFHSTPSNVPINFAFSLVAGLLAGNINIVRLPAKNFFQVKCIINEMKRLFDERFLELSPYVLMVKYDSATGCSRFFSELCDVRIVWGGDQTIVRMRKFPLRPRAIELNFADRHSLSVIDADKYLALDCGDQLKVARGFYNDTFYSDQNACTSPWLICWLGGQAADAKVLFWDNLSEIVESEYSIAPVQVIDKLKAFYSVAARKKVKLVKGNDQLITRISVERVDEYLACYRKNSGFFFEYDAKSLEDLLPVLDQSCQTLTYFGVALGVLKDFIRQSRPSGVDRVVPLGKSMDFSLTWDGYDLVRTLSREVEYI